MLSNMNKPLLVAIEGNTGTGKTTLANNLLQNLRSEGYKAVYLKSAPSSSIMGKFIKKFFSEEPTIYSLFCYGADILIQDELYTRRLLHNGNIVIHDRFKNSILAYNSLFLKNKIDKEALELFKKLPISEPDITFLLESSFETIESRIKKRALKSKVDSSIKRISVEKLGRIYGELEKYNNAIVINTTNITEKEVTDIALAKIKEYAGV